MLTRVIFSTLFFIALFNEHFAQQLAFPGADGFGRFTIGGRGGKLYEVLNLNDKGPGSLREAVEAYGARTVVFKVSGTITLETKLIIRNPYITIAGQTAPGDGICLRKNSLFISADQVIIRFMRFRLGDIGPGDDDALGGRDCKHVIVDHCSVSWSIDEVMSFYDIDSLTIQWCISSESLYMSHHAKGAHGYGGIWGGRNVSYHHNLIAHHSSRTPRFQGGETGFSVNVDFRNNVIYNWGFNSVYGGEGGRINIVSNYYKPGPATKNDVKNRIVEPYDKNGKWYIENNYIFESESITNNNWKGGVQGSYASEKISRAYEPFPYSGIETQSPSEAFIHVLNGAGAILPDRDTIDKRIIHEVETGTATYEGKTYETLQGLSDTSVIRGIIDSQNDVGGWPELYSSEQPLDSDRDGVADYYENINNMYLNDPLDGNLIAPNGYTNLENYINQIVASNITN